MSNGEIQPPKVVKPGVATTEFWLTIATAVLGVFGEVAKILPPPWGIVLAGIATAGYAISRGIAKN